MLQLQVCRLKNCIKKAYYYFCSFATNDRAISTQRYAWNKTQKSLRFGDLFNNQSWHWVPACISVWVSSSRTISNVDSNTDSSLVDVFTVAFYCSRSVVIFISVSDPQSRVNGHRTTAFCSIKGDEPALTTFVTTHVYITLINHS